MRKAIKGLTAVDRSGVCGVFGRAGKCVVCG